MAKYTKGPWEVRQPFYSKGNLFAVFCGMSGRTRRLDNLKGEFVEADARLIAAAPELVEALDALRKQALQSELNCHANEWGMEAIEKATAALIKAGVE